MPAYNPNPVSRNSHFEPLYTTDTTDTAALTFPADLTAVPSGHCIVLMPFLKGLDGVTSVMQVYGVRKVGGAALWTHEAIAEFDLTAGTGIAGTGLLYADTIVNSNSPSLADEVILSPLTDFANGNATVTFHNKGWEYLFIAFNVGTATASNTYVAIM